MKKEVEEYDWRLQAITTLAKDAISPTGKKMKKGEPLILVSPIEVNGEKTYIHTPNPIAMLLNISNINYKNSCKKFNFKELKKSNKDDEKDYFDSIEFYMASIIFAYTALEIFSNYSIPDYFKFPKIREDKKCIEIYNKEQIEKNIKLDLKISEILPIIYKIDSFKGTKKWEEYLELKNIRDRIIHLKSNDTQYNKKGNPYKHLWNDLINNGEIKDYTKIAKGLIEYFYKDKKPRWLNKCPF
jgi:hypothetical protein